MNIETSINILIILISVSIFFVWVVRYDHIIKEFNEYGLPGWLRDFVGILKLSFSGMLVSGIDELILIGSAGISILMFCALVTHLKVKNKLYKMIPSFTLMVLSVIIFTSIYI